MKNVISIHGTGTLASLLASLAAACSHAPTPADTRELLQDLSGEYADPESYAYGPGAYGQRVFTFDRGRWTLEFTLALDPELEERVFAFRTYGTYIVQEASTTVPRSL